MRRQTDVSSPRSIPALTELQSRPQWVCWRKEERRGKPTKVPYNPRTGSFARSDDPSTWASFDTARQVYERSLTKRQPYDGIGYMFQRDYTGIDLDHCVSADGSIDPGHRPTCRGCQAMPNTPRARPASISWYAAPFPAGHAGQCLAPHVLRPPLSCTVNGATSR